MMIFLIRYIFGNKLIYDNRKTGQMSTRPPPVAPLPLALAFLVLCSV
jgi:hypothetical protein